jgi:hypothetical protein
VSTGGTINIDVPIVPTVKYSTASTLDKTWTSPDYTSTVTIVLSAAGGGGGSSGNPDSGGNDGGNGARVSMVLTGVPPGTVFTYIVGSGGGGSQDLTPQVQAPPPKDNFFNPDGILG